MGPELKEALKGLYRVFRNYELKTPLHMHWGDQVREPVSTALRQLSVDEMTLPLGKMLTTWGEVEDLKHLLPRIAELIACERIGWTTGLYDTAVLGYGLHHAEWTSWRTEEKVAIESFVLALWEDRLKYPKPAETSIDHYMNKLRVVEVLDLYGAADAQLMPALHVWEGYLNAMHSATALNERVAAFRCGVAAMTEQKRHDSPPRLTVFDATDRPARAFAEWILSERVMGLLERTVMETKSAEVACELSDALASCEHCRLMLERPPEE
jgi:hypothetical protein